MILIGKKKIFYICIISLHVFLVSLPNISPEISFIFILLFFSTYLFKRIDRKKFYVFFKIISIPLLIIFFGLLFSFNNNIIDVIRDLFRYSFPVAVLAFGYYVATTFSLKEFIRLLLLSGFLHSSIQLILNIYYGASFENTSTLFKTMNNYLCPITLSLLIANLKFRFKLFNRNIMIMIFLVNLINLFLLNMRTHFLAVFIITFSILGVFKISSKISIKNLLFLISPFLLFFTMYFIFGFQFHSRLFESFTEFIPKNYSSEEDIRQFWRGYESYRGLITFSSKDLIYKIFGGGFGSKVDLLFTISLGQAENQYRYITQLHNGYVEIILKTGVLGTLMYLSFFFKNIFSNLRPNKNLSLESQFIKNSIFGLSLMLLLVTTFNGGLIDYDQFSAIFLLGFLLNKNHL